MGGGCGHFNAPEMAEMGYISGCNMLAVTSSGTFEIGPIEKRCAGPQVLQVPGAANVNQGQQYIYVEYRNGKGTVGSDNKSPQGIYFHASAEPGGLPAPMPPDPDLPYVVDPFYIHAPLTSANASWTESTSGATFTLVSVGNTATVQVSLPGGGDGGAVKCVDGTMPPTSPTCGVSPDAGGTGGTGGTSGKDASTDVGTGGAAGSAGSGGAAGTGGSAGTAGSGTTDAGRDTGTGAAGTGGSSGTAGTGGSAGSAGKGGSSGTGGTGGAAGSGGGGTSGSGGSAGSATGGSAGSGGGSAGASGSTGTAGKGGSGATGGSSTGSGGSGTADDGCSCSVPGGQRSNTTPWMMLGLAALLPALRRRSRR
jgi:MYXO-CTERM domain-containing protein